MTDRLYYHDSYILDFQAGVTAIDRSDGKYCVRLDRSAFYPTSGGQLFDTGLLGGEKVIDVVEETGDVLHILADKPAFEVGDEVDGKIDEVRRRDNMQKHTGQHILSRAFIEIGNAETVSARLSEEDSTVDLNRGNLSDDDLTRVEDLANLIIFQNRQVKINFLPYDKLTDIPLRKIPERGEGKYRIITIDDFDWSACGGTHCRQTGAVGIIKITGREKVRDTMRFHFLTGILAMEDYRWRFDQIERISNIFTRHGKESLAAVENLVEENDRLRKKTLELKRDMLPARIDRWWDMAVDTTAGKVIALDFSDEDFREARDVALAIINKFTVVLLIRGGDKLLVAASKDTSQSASDLLKRLADNYGGRGGGSPQLAQGGGFNPDDLKVLIADPEKVFDI
jgi:alanyl-tRNA synthetase